MSSIVNNTDSSRLSTRTERDIDHRWPTASRRNEMRQIHEEDTQRKRASSRSARSEHGPSVLLAEDDGEMRRLLATALRWSGYQVIECEDGVSLTWRLREIEHRDAADAFDLIISDIWMPGITALEVLEGMHDREMLPPVILITAFGDASTHARAEHIGVVALFDKPFEIDELLGTVRELTPPR